MYIYIGWIFQDIPMNMSLICHNISGVHPAWFIHGPLDSDQGRAHFRSHWLCQAPATWQRPMDPWIHGPMDHPGGSLEYSARWHATCRFLQSSHDLIHSDIIRTHLRWQGSLWEKSKPPALHIYTIHHVWYWLIKIANSAALWPLHRLLQSKSTSAWRRCP